LGPPCECREECSRKAFLLPQFEAFVNQNSDKTARCRAKAGIGSSGLATLIL
jgi:hypothetical protein